MRSKLQVRMLATVLGTFYGNDAGVKRGDIVELPTEDAVKRLCSTGSATREHWDTPVDELPAPYEETEETRALADWARRDTLTHHVPEDVQHRVPGTPGYRPEIGLPIGGRQRVREGWLG